jgi:iron-sulfur cluster repair protein YtfE (RIC family)
MNAFELLKKDHGQVSRIMEQLEAVAQGRSRKREELFNRLRDELRIHSAIEERIFYPALKDAQETRELVLEALEEHKIVEQLLDELDSLSMDDIQWPAKLAVLKENVEHHVEEEEKELFKAARKILDKSRIDELGRRLEEEKQQLAATA